jgi:hypothetical protein
MNCENCKKNIKLTEYKNYFTWCCDCYYNRPEPKCKCIYPKCTCVKITYKNCAIMHSGINSQKYKLIRKSWAEYKARE